MRSSSLILTIEMRAGKVFATRKETCHVLATKHPAGLRALLRRDLADREMGDEVRDFLEREALAHEEAGLSPEAAARAARVSMGSVVSVEEAVRSSGWEAIVVAFWRDLRYGARMLGRTPAFSAIAVLTLALGIGATTALFSVANEVLFKPLPVSDPGRLVFFGWNAKPKATPPVSVAGMNLDATTGRAWSTAFSRLALERFQSETRTLTGVFAFAAARASSAPGDTAAPSGHLVSGSYFAVLGTPPLLGRLLAPADDRENAPLVVVISHRYWRRAFGGRSRRARPHDAVLIRPSPRSSA